MMRSLPSSAGPGAGKTCAAASFPAAVTVEDPAGQRPTDQPANNPPAKQTTAITPTRARFMRCLPFLGSEQRPHPSKARRGLPDYSLEGAVVPPRPAELASAQKRHGLSRPRDPL